MTGKTHALLGVTAAIGFAAVTKYPIGWGLLIGGYIGSLFPDTDCDTASLGRIIPTYLIPGCYHRGPIHSIETGILLGAIAYFVISPAFGIGWLMGHISHMLSDMLNMTSVRLSWFSQKHICLGLFRVATSGEFAFAMLTLFAFVYLVWVYILYTPANLDNLLNQLLKVAGKLQ